jgi:hypothetical protein
LKEKVSHPVEMAQGMARASAEHKPARSGSGDKMQYLLMDEVKPGGFVQLTREEIERWLGTMLARNIAEFVFPVVHPARPRQKKIHREELMRRLTVVGRCPLPPEA